MLITNSEVEHTTAAQQTIEHTNIEQGTLQQTNRENKRGIACLYDTQLKYSRDTRQTSMCGSENEFYEVQFESSVQTPCLQLHQPLQKKRRKRQRNRSYLLHPHTYQDKLLTIL